MSLCHFSFYFKPVSGQVMCADLHPLHSRRQNSVETEIIRGITHTHTLAHILQAYLLGIGMKKALCSLIGSVGCCNLSA